MVVPQLGCITPLNPLPPSPSPMQRTRKARGQCGTVRSRLLNFQSPSFPKMSCLFLRCPCRIRQGPLFPARSSCLSFLSPHTPPPPPDALRLLLLALSSCFPAPSPSFLCSGSVQYRTAQVPKTLQLPILAAWSAATASIFSQQRSTKHQAQRRPWSAQKHEKPSESISTATVRALLCCSVLRQSTYRVPCTH